MDSSNGLFKWAVFCFDSVVIKMKQSRPWAMFKEEEIAILFLTTEIQAEFLFRNPV